MHYAGTSIHIAICPTAVRRLKVKPGLKYNVSIERIGDLPKKSKGRK